MPQSVTSQMLGTFDLVGQPIKLERTPSSLVAASPECGEHTDEILADLGYAEDQIAELRERDAI
jgi:formyl-CoA transferase